MAPTERAGLPFASKASLGRNGAPAQQPMMMTAVAESSPLGSSLAAAMATKGTTTKLTASSSMRTSPSGSMI